MSNLFPTDGHIEQETFWTGLRPITLDDTPLVSASAPNILYLNTGHSPLGWTMECIWAIAGGYYQRTGVGYSL